MTAMICVCEVDIAKGTSKSVSVCDNPVRDTATFRGTLIGNGEKSITLRKLQIKPHDEVDLAVQESSGFVKRM